MDFTLISPHSNHLAREIVRPLMSRVQKRGRKIDFLRRWKMERSGVREKIAKHEMRNSNLLPLPETFRLSTINPMTTIDLQKVQLGSMATAASSRSVENANREFTTEVKNGLQHRRHNKLW